MAGRQPSQKFTTVEAAQRQPPGRVIDVIGVVSDCMPMKKCYGSSFMITFTLKDTSYASLKVRCFRNDYRKLPVPKVGDAIALLNVKLSEFKGQVMGLSSHDVPSPWVIYTKSRDDVEGIKIVTSQLGITLSKPDIDYIAVLLDAKKGGSKDSDAPSDIFNSRSSSPPRRPRAEPPERSVLLRDAQPFQFVDIVCQVVKIFDDGYPNRFTLYVTDYTRNDMFYDYDRPSRFESYIESKRKWEGPTGRYTLQVTLWDVNAYHARRLIREGDIVTLFNVNLKIHSGVMEGKLHGNRRNPNKVEIRVHKEEDRDPKVAGLIQRRADYWRKLNNSSNISNHSKDSNGDSKEISKRKRKHDKREERESRRRRYTEEMPPLEFHAPPEPYSAEPYSAEPERRHYSREGVRRSPPPPNAPTSPKAMSRRRNSRIRSDMASVVGTPPYQPDRPFYPERAYRTERDYPYERQYRTERDYSPERAYEPERAYQPEETYQPEREYSSERTYRSERDYPSERTYEPERAYQPEKPYESQRPQHFEKSPLAVRAKNLSPFRLNPSVRSDHIAVKPVPLEDILRQRYIHTTPEGVSYRFPFLNRCYRARVRVVDFFPSRIEDFAVECRAQNDHSDNESEISWGMDVDIRPKWTWRFGLVVQDAGPKARHEKEPQTMELIVADQDAERLLRMNAADLRSDAHALDKLRSTLSVLWGNLEQIKDKGGQSTDRSEPLEAPAFTCCIKEYGVRTGDEWIIDTGADGSVESPLSIAGWERRFRIFGTSITSD